MKLQVSAIEFVSDDSVVATIAMEGDTLVVRAIDGFKIKAEAQAGVQLLAQDASAKVEGGEVTLAAASEVKAQAQVIDLDASDALRENANGVGHTYTGTQVHYWVPMEGTSNWPAPPQHPMAGSDTLVGDA
ncbi:hypothetical protein QF021_000282 [Acidovorax delafieldii]|uniref:hypothetical protein n=1 Tax=Acidovorax delafieldii TaxID=47920 RepID=UPI00286268B1|nr:hypothetical protein [Acidovorax delafieldii]MDR6152193.1 hypothetical protein [Acidovorax delafieldii]